MPNPAPPERSDMRQVKLGNKLIGDGQPAFIIAEMAWAHDGSVEKAKKIIRGAAEAKADAINFHITSMDDYMVPHYGSSASQGSAGLKDQRIFDFMKSICLSQANWKELFGYARDRNLIISAMCNDLPSVQFASQQGADMYNIHSSCLAEEQLIKEVAANKKPVLLKVGGTYLGEMEKVVSHIHEAGNEDIMFMHGIQNYPTRLEDMHLNFMQTLKQIFDIPVGFGDHTDGGSDLAMSIPLVAVACGANLIEKHVTHDRSLKGVDYESAIDLPELGTLVHNIRDIEKAFGSSSMRPFSIAEIEYRQTSKKRTVAATTIEKGEVISSDKIAFKRSDDGVYPDESKYLLGRTAKVRIEKNQPITWDKTL